MPKPILQWACRELCGGWMMIGVDVDLSAPGEPEALLGYRRAIHPAHFDESTDPVMTFGCVIAEMTYRIHRGLEVEAQPQTVSRARAFVITEAEQDRVDAYWLGGQ